MARTISVELSEKGIRKAINELKSYQNDLNRKVGVFVERLSKLGVEVTRASMGSIPSNEEVGKWNVDIKMSAHNDFASATITLSGDKILFLEFGAGIVYITQEHPLAKKLGYGSGTYPNQTHVPDPGFWRYKNEKGETVKSYGNRAYMPMYHASEALAIQLREIAMEVFGK